MILQRFSRAIAQQNWVVVIIEIFVVVLGILIGLHLDDWNQGRKAMRQESVYLEKLHQDLAVMQVELGERLQRNNESIEHMTAALYALEDCTDTAESRSNIQYALERYQVSPGLNFQDATYDEMVASGALAGLSDQNLKYRISNTFSELEQVNNRLQSFRISIPNIDLITWKNVVYSIDKESGRMTTSFKVADLCQINEIRNAVVEMIDIQMDGRQTALRSLAGITELIELLETRSNLDR